MKLLKKLIAVFALVVAITVMGVSVNAVTYSNNNQTATWTTSDMDGLLLSKAENPTAFDSSAVYVDANTLAIKKYIMLIPVPSSTSTGTITITPNGNNTSRYAYLIDNTSNTCDTTLSFVMSGTPSQNFTSANILTYNEAYYVGLIAYNGSSRFDFKISTLVLTLTSSDSYASQYTVSYYLQGGTDVIATENVVGGETATTDVKNWGNTITGYYTDSACTSEWDKVVNEDVNIYCTYTAWDSSVYGDGNTLSLDLITRGYEVYGTTTLTSNAVLTNTNYTILSGDLFYANAATVGDYGTSTAAIKFSNAFSSGTNGIKFEASGAGTITVYARPNSSSDNDYAGMSLYNSTYTSVATSTETTNKATIAAMNVTVPSAGTYYLGNSERGMYVYYVSFTEETTSADSATINGAYSVGTSTVDSTTSAVRFLGRIVGVEYSDITSVTLTITGDTAVNKTITTFYGEISDMTGAGAATDTLYFYYSIYGLTSTYNGKTITFTYIVNFADGSTKTLSSAVSYTVAL